MAQPIMSRSERQRQLQQLSFAEGSLLTRDLPKDTVLKSLSLRLSGAVQTTFASGTPVADAQSTFDNLIPRIDVVVNGSRTVKSVRPHLMHMQQLLSRGIQGARRASAAAAAATDNFPTADGGFTYGTTTQYTTVVETVLVSFEHVYADEVHQPSTWLNLQGVAAAEVKLQCSTFSKLLGFGNTAPVTFGNSTLVVDIFTNEAKDVDPRQVFLDWKQTTREVSFSAETTEYAVDINKGNRLTGIMLFARDGAAGSATTATGKLASNLAVTKLSLMLNGSEIIKATNFKALQDENRSKFGVSAPFASNVSRLDGVAFMNLLNRGDLNTALDVRPGVADSVQLLVSTNTASNVSYTNPVSVTIMTDELVPPR